MSPAANGYKTPDGLGSSFIIVLTNLIIADMFFGFSGVNYVLNMM